MIRKVIQDYLKSEKLQDIGYVVCNNEVMLPFISSLESWLDGYSTHRYGNKLVVSDHDLPDYYTAYRILSDKRTKPIRVMTQAVVYKISTCIIGLLDGTIIAYPENQLLVDIGPDNPDNRETAYILGVTYGQKTV